MLSKLHTKRNLLLAWRRINTATNYRYKNFFRHSYDCFALAEQDLLANLRNKLRANWSPSNPTVLWIPKANRLHRAISLLPIEDQVVLQALVNLCVEKLRRRRLAAERFVRSNRLNASHSIFFVRHWRDCYQDFQRACRGHFVTGSHWVLRFDLSAFYDTISHNLLLHTIAPRSFRSDEWQIVSSWLQTWSLSSPGQPAGHGLPQGPLASDLLAELFLLPVDEVMAARKYRYVRYVDDIRVFARSENEAARAALDLELACRSRGLIPQARKFEIVRASSAKQIFSVLPSRASGPVGRKMTRAQTRAQMARSITGNPLRIGDRSRLRHTMYGGEADPKTRNRVLRLLPRHPEEIEPFTYFLSQFPNSPVVKRAIVTLLRSNIAYPYVRARLWDLAAQVGHTDAGWMLGLLPAASREWGSAENDSLRWGVMSFLLACRAATGKPSILRRFRQLPPPLQSMLVPQVPVSEFSPKGLVARVLRQGPDSVSMCLAPRLVALSITHNSLGINAKQLRPSTQHAFRSIGIIKSKQRRAVDPVGEILRSRYACPGGCKWKRLLATDYAHALQVLRLSDQLHASNPSAWLQYLDSFNDIWVRRLIDELRLAGLAGGAVTVNAKGKLVPYGSFLAGTHPFLTSHGPIATELGAIHARRNRLPASHPYHLGATVKTPNKRLRHSQRARFEHCMRRALANLPGAVTFL